MAVSSVERQLRPDSLSSEAAEAARKVAVSGLRTEAGAGGEDIAHVLRHAFVDPEELALLGGGKVRLVELVGATVFAVPGVGELMGEEVGLGELVDFVGETFFANAVVGGLLVLEAFAAGDVGQGEEEVVGVVMVRGVGGAGFADEVGDFGQELGAEVGVFGEVGDDVDEVPGGDFGGEGELVEVLAGDDGGVFELLDGGDGVLLRGGAGGGVVVVLEDAGGGWRGVAGAPVGGEGGADAPAGRDGDGGLDFDVLDGDVGGIHHEALPLEAGHLAGVAALGDVVEVDVKIGDAGGDVDVELVEVDVVAAPGDRVGRWRRRRCRRFVRWGRWGRGCRGSTGG